LRETVLATMVASPIKNVELCTVEIAGSRMTVQSRLAEYANNFFMIKSI
jgi:hypothetical protein